MNYLFVCILGLFLTIQPLFAQKNKKQQVKDKEFTANTNELSSADKEAMLLAEKYLIEGLKYKNLDNYKEAINNFQKALTLNSKSSGIHYQLAETMLKSGKNASALFYAQKALDLDEDNSYNYILLAKVLESLQDYTKAADTYEKMLANPAITTPQYYYELALLYQNHIKDYKKAIEAYEQLEKKYGINEKITRNKQAIFIKQGKLDLAMYEAERLMQTDPQEPAFILSYAEMLLANNQTEKATQALEKISSGVHPANAQANVLLADIYKKQNRTADSEKQVELALANPSLDQNARMVILQNYTRADSPEIQQKGEEIIEKTALQNPQNLDAQFSYAQLLEKKKKWVEAREIYLRIVQTDNTRFDAWKQLLHLNAELYNTEWLIKDAQDALDLYPTQAIFWLYSGRGYFQKKEYSAALEIYEQGIDFAVTKELKNEFNIRIADCYQELKQYEKADLLFEEVLGNDPDNIIALNNYSFYLAKRKYKLDLAKKNAKKLLELSPEKPAFLDTYAFVLYAQGNYKEAKKILEKALTNEVTNGIILEHYGDVLYRLGDTQKALEQWQKAQKMPGTSESIEQKITEKKIVDL